MNHRSHTKPVLPVVIVLIVACAGFWALRGLAAVAPQPARGWLTSDGFAVAAVDGDTLHVAGSFTAIAEDRGPVLLIDRNTGELLPGIAPMPLQSVSNALVDPDGGLYLDSPTGVARLRANGQLDGGFRPTAFGTPLGIVGRRLLIGLRQGTGLQVIDRDTGVALGGPIEPGSGQMRSWGSLDDGTVLVVLGNILLRVEIESGVVRWRTTLSVSARRVPVAASGSHAFVAVNSQLYRVDRHSGALTTVMAVGPDCGEFCNVGIDRLVLNGGLLAITGQFQEPALNFVVLDAASGAVVNTRAPAGISQVFAAGSRLYATFNDPARPLAALDASTLELLDWNPRLLRLPADVITIGPYVVAIGPRNGRAIPRLRAASMRLADGFLTNWQPTIDFTPATMTAGGGKVFIAGYRCPVSGCPIGVSGEPVLAQYDATTGARLATWSPRLDGRVGAVALSGSRLFIGGAFAAIDGSPRSCLASFDLSGETPTLEAWAPQVHCAATSFDLSSIAAVLPSSAGVFVAGRFTQVAGQPRHYLALVDTATGALDPWNLITDPASYFEVPASLAVQGSYLVVGGPAVAGRAPAVFDLTRRQPLAALPDSFYSRAGAVVFESEIFLATGQSLDVLTGRLTGDRGFYGHGGVMAAASGVVQQLQYFPRVEIPGAPQNLRATVTGHQVQLQWDPPLADSRFVGAPSGYVLEVASTPQFTDISSIDLGSASLSYSAVAPAGRYYLRLRARGTGGTGAPSNSILIVAGTAGCTEPPSMPTNLQSTTAGLSFTWAWSQPTQGGPVGSYEVRVGTDPGNLTLVALTLPPSPAFSASGPAGTYYWAMQAINGCGASGFTAPAILTLRSPESVQPPRNLRSTVSPDRTVTLEWDLPGVEPVPAGFVIEAGSQPGLANLAALPTTGLSLVVPNVPPGTYFVQVRSTLAGAVSAAGNSVTVTVP